MERLGVREREAARSWRFGRFERDGESLIPWLWPAKSVVRAARRAGRHKEAGCLRALTEGGWRTQRRFFVDGRSSHDICQCGEGVDDVWHRLGECAWTADERIERCPERLLKAGRTCTADPLFHRGAPARPNQCQSTSSEYGF